MPEPTIVDTSAGSNFISVAWLSLSPAISGTKTLGVVTLVIPAGAQSGQTYTLHVTGASGSQAGSQVNLGAGPDTTVTAQGTQPDFQLSVSPSSQTVNPGSSVMYTVSVTASGGFSSSVTLSCSGLPSGATCSFAPNPAPPGASTLTLSTGTSTPAGTVTFTVTGAGGTLTHTATASLTVSTSPIPRIGLSTSSLSFSATPGLNPASQGLGIANSGGGTLSWTASATTSSGGQWLSVSPASGTAPSTLTVAVTSATLASGTYNGTITIAASGASNSPQTVSVKLTVGQSLGVVSTTGGSGAPGTSFSIPITLSLSSSISIDSVSFGVQVVANSSAPALTGSLSFSKDASIPPPTLTDTGAGPNFISLAWLGAFNPALSGTKALGVVIMTIPSGAQNGQTYTLRITGASGSVGPSQVSLLSGSDTTLTVTGGVQSDFQLSISPASQSVTAGGVANYTLSITGSGGFSSQVSLSCSGLPTGASCSFSPNPASPGVISFTVSIPGSTPSANVNLVVTGTSGSRTHTASALLTVVSNQVPEIGLSVTSLAFSSSPGASPPSQTLGIINNGGGSLSWTASAATSGGGNWLRVSSASGTAPSTLTVSIDSAALPAGTYAGSISISASTASNSPETVAVQLTVSATSNPVPGINSLVPASAVPGGSSFQLTVNGTGFIAQSVVRWNGSDRPTTFVNSTQLYALILGSDIAAQGSAQVVVFNPAPVGGVSNTEPFSITPAAGKLTIVPGFLNFSSPPTPPGQTLLISGVEQWTGETKTNSGGNWLRLSSLFGTASTALVVKVDPSGLAPDTYTGLVAVRDSFDSTKSVGVQIALVVSKIVPLLRLSQAGFLFLGMEGLTQIPSKTFQVLNVGEGTMNWVVSDVTPGPNWLTISPTTGSSPPHTSEQLSKTPTVGLSVNPSSLKAGIYVRLLTIEGKDAPNSPQNAIVVLNILPAGSEPAGLVDPAGLIFLSAPGGSPAPQGLALSSTGGRAVQFTAVARTSGANWLTVEPSAGVLPAAGGTVTLGVKASASALSSGIYIGKITVSLNTGRSQEVAVVMVVTTAAISLGLDAPVPLGGPPVWAAETCTASALSIVETKLAGNFVVPVGSPGALIAKVTDNCAKPIADATVVATFSNGDSLLNLSSLRDGRYAGTWTPVKDARAVTVTLLARAAGLPDAQVKIEGTVAPAGAPIAFRNGAVSAASFARFQPLSPGSIVAIFGQNLAQESASATSLPLPVSLADVRVTLGGLAVPLFYAGSGQINAQVPSELTPGKTASLLVTVRGVAAPPDDVTLSAVQPAIFSMDSSGTGQGAILNLNYKLVDEKNPAKVKDIVQVFCTGLGATTPPVASGTAAPVPPAVANVSVTATIGGVNAPVSFAGLTPTLVGLYQVNVEIPAGVPVGPAVPLVITQSGVSSNTVTLAIH